MCDAEWRSDAGILPCPGIKGDKDGYIALIATPKFESGYVDDEPALMTVPEAVENGEIVGKFLPILIPANSAFRTVVGCLYDSETCDVEFVVKYQIEGEDEKILGTWNEKYDDEITHINEDLDALGMADKKVTFKFEVQAKGTGTDNKAFWLHPMVTGP